jgi:hypothetical protein
MKSITKLLLVLRQTGDGSCCIVDTERGTKLIMKRAFQDDVFDTIAGSLHRRIARTPGPSLGMEQN